MDDERADYVVRMVTDRHAVTVFDVDGPRLTMTRIDEAGDQVDQVVITRKRLS